MRYASGGPVGVSGDGAQRALDVALDDAETVTTFTLTLTAGTSLATMWRLIALPPAAGVALP